MNFFGISAPVCLLKEVRDAAIAGALTSGIDETWSELYTVIISSIGTCTYHTVQKTEVREDIRTRLLHNCLPVAG